MTPDDRIALLMQEIAALRMRVATLEKLVVERGSTAPPPPPNDVRYFETGTIRAVACDGRPRDGEETAAGFAPPTMMRVRAPRGR